MQVPFFLSKKGIATLMNLILLTFYRGFIKEFHMERENLRRKSLQDFLLCDN